jgi:SAM-dependent methyltransferase
MKVCIYCNFRFENPGWRCPQCGQQPEREDYILLAPEQEKCICGFREDFFKPLADLEENHFWFQFRNHLITWSLAKYFPDSNSFLELGCGTGNVLSHIEKTCPHLTLFGSDISTAGLDFASKRLTKAQLFQMDMHSIPFEQQFDVIGAFDALEHTEDDQMVLKQMFQAIRIGGGAILTVPQHEFLWTKFDEVACHVRRYIMTDLKAKAEDVGFNVVAYTSFMFLLFPAMIISRIITGLKSFRSYDVTEELRINPFINSIFKQILNLEKIMIRSGIKLPFGSSILMVLKRR